jgi:hypothetical protein
LSGSLIGITNGLMAFTAALDSTYATDAQLYQLYAETASIKAEIGGIEAYTASLKGAAIVSSSQQITNYYKFAETASANTFYGNQTFASSGGSGLRVYGGAGTHQWDMYLNGQNIRLSDNTAGDGALIVDTRAYFGGHVTASSNLTANKVAIGSTVTPTIPLEVYGQQKWYTTTGDGSELRGFFNPGGAADDPYLSLYQSDGTTEGIKITPDGIDFSANSNAAGMTSELLNDYEEGTWTVGISFGGNSVGITTSRNTGTYVKVGRQVTVNGDLILTSKGSSSGAARITGLPFTNGAGVSNLSPIILRLAKVTFANQLQGYVEVSATTISLEEITEAGTVTQLSNSDFANDSELMVTATYFV